MMNKAYEKIDEQSMMSAKINRAKRISPVGKKFVN